jgi:hypothetical protein
MYQRNASEDQQPISTPARYMAMAPSERIEWVPMSRCEKPRTSGPMRSAVAWSWAARKVEVTSRRLSFVRTVLTREPASHLG